MMKVQAVADLWSPMTQLVIFETDQLLVNRLLSLHKTVHCSEEENVEQAEINKVSYLAALRWARKDLAELSFRGMRVYLEGNY